MKIVTVIGARPQFIKAAAVSREIAKHPEIQEIIVHTGQHFDKNMSDIFFEEMEIPRPQYQLEINSLSHGAMTGRMLEKIEDVLLHEKPDYVMVYGDTNSTLSGALAAKKLHIKVAHVEAGLRSFNMNMPEEINRILTDRISDLLFCPTDNAVANLKKEGFDEFPCRIEKVGDVMYDAALYYSEFSANKSTIIKDLELEENGFALCTVHRAENTDDSERLKGIFEALSEISREMAVVLPIHPRTRKILESLNYTSLLTLHPSLKLIDPVGYFDMIELLRNTRIVLTDSGGLQKEAYFFKKPCVTLRDETEWVELVEGCFNKLCGSSPSRILQSFKVMRGKMCHADADIYGKGNASKRICDSLQNKNSLEVL